MDSIAYSLGLDPLKIEDYVLFEQEFSKMRKTLPKKVVGPMHPEIKKAISQTLMGHTTSKETREKISKTITIRNSEKVCGFGLGHSEIAGKLGGKSKSKKKVDSVKLNQAKSLETIRGSSWMINLKLNKRKRVPKNMIEEYKANGYILGSKGSK